MKKGHGQWNWSMKLWTKLLPHAGHWASLLVLGKDAWPALQAPRSPCVFCEQEPRDTPLPQSACPDVPRPLL